MRFVVLIILTVLLCSLVTARDFRGNATISIVELTGTTLKVCSPNQKYIMAPGTSRIIKLGVRNVMANKTVKRLNLVVEAPPDLIISFTPESIVDLVPDEHWYFDANVTVPKGTPWGNHQIRFLVGTDEYAVGAFEFPVLIKVRPYGHIMVYGMAVGAIVLIVLAVVRAISIYGTNRKPRARHLLKKKPVSLKYYKG